MGSSFPRTYRFAGEGERSYREMPVPVDSKSNFTVDHRLNIECWRLQTESISMTRGEKNIDILIVATTDVD